MFIGVNEQYFFNERLVGDGAVTVLYKLSRPGAAGNLERLQTTAHIRFERADIRDSEVIEIVGEIRPDMVLRLAAQVAVTSSVVNPREDLEVNALGTFNMLEAVRRKSRDSFFLNASTNKVYGRMEDLDVVEHNGRYDIGISPKAYQKTGR